MAVRADDAQQGSARERRRRRGAAVGVVLILVAVAIALLGASLLTRYMEARVSAARVPTARVVVAKLDIPVARPIQADWLEVMDWPAAARPAGAVADTAALVGQVAIVPIARGEAVLPAKLVTAGARSGLATLLPAGMRAAAVRVDDVVGVAGFVHPGDYVDVLVTMKPKDDGPFVAKVVLQNVKVLAVGKDFEAQRKEEKSTPATVATLMVSSEESEHLALAATKGQILLTLRGLGDEDLVDTDGVTPPVLLAWAPRAPAPVVATVPRRSVARTAAPASAPPKQVVEILRGDLYEKRNFEPDRSRP